MPDNPNAPKPAKPEGPDGQLLIYRDGATRVQVRLEGRTLWLSQRLIAELFQVSVPTVSEHLANIYADRELDPEATLRSFRIVQTEGTRQVSRTIDHYNLDAILAVGYRVRSARGTAFRQWATARLSELLVKGFTLDDERLKEGRSLGADYFDEAIEEVKRLEADGTPKSVPGSRNPKEGGDDGLPDSMARSAGDLRRLRSRPYPLRLPPRARREGRRAVWLSHLFCLTYRGGGGGIRTHGPRRVNGFQDRRFRPLSHPSAGGRDRLAGRGPVWLDGWRGRRAPAGCRPGKGGRGGGGGMEMTGSPGYGLPVGEGRAPGLAETGCEPDAFASRAFSGGRPGRPRARACGRRGRSRGGRSCTAPCGSCRSSGGSPRQARSASGARSE